VLLLAQAYRLAAKLIWVFTSFLQYP
jgi:hypothetical protein